MKIPDPVPDFAYYDGVKVVHCDRLATFRELLIRTGGKPNALPNRICAVDPNTQDIAALMDSYHATTELITLIRDLFQMVPFNRLDGTGARDEHCWAVWNAFDDAMSESKKKPADSQTISTPGAVPPTSPQPGTSTSASH